MNRIIRSFTGLRQGIVVLMSVVITLLFYATDISFIQRLERGTQDLRMQLRGQRPARSDIIIIYLDNDDIEKLGSWPVKRNYYAYLFEGILKYRPKAVGFHIFFDPNRRTYTEYDDMFALSAEKVDNLVLPYYFGELAPPERPVSQRETVQPENLPESYAAVPLPEGMSWLRGEGPTLPPEKFRAGSSRLGFTNLIADNDGVIRRSPLLLAFNGRLYPSFSMQLFRSLNPDFAKTEIIDPKTIKAGYFQPIYLPLDNNSSALLNYPGDWDSFQTYSFLEILQNINLEKRGMEQNINLNILTDKIILISASPLGKSSFYTTPFSSNFPEIGIHATMLDNLIGGSFLYDCTPLLKGIVLLLFLLLLQMMIFSFEERIGIIGSIVMFGTYLFLSFFLFSRAEIILDVFKPAISFLIIGFSAVFAVYTEQRSLRQGIEKEKVVIETELTGKIIKLQELEKTLQEKITMQKGALEKEKLAEDIRRYKDTIAGLKSDIQSIEKKHTAGTPVRHKTEQELDIIYSTRSKLRENIELVQKISGEDVSVLIYGESGTGKELFARLIHLNSKRKNRPFIAVNCGALTETLLESELFGHEKGSFTGAVASKKGRFELADGGTLFLDEISETSLSFQVKLLRVLQEGEFERVGGTQVKKVDVRIITATNRNLLDEIKKGTFREDLYYRLNVFSLNLPTLKDRQEDIQALATHFISRNTDNAITVSSEALEALKSYRWPGNIRELENIIKRAIILVNSEKRKFIGIEDLPAEIRKDPAGLVKAEPEEDDFEQQLLNSLRSLKFSRGAITQTAEKLGNMNRGTVAEYFRGICFKAFCETDFNLQKAADQVASSPDAAVTGTVKKKIQAYVSNVTDALQTGMTAETAFNTVKGKYTNLPKRYHPSLTAIIEEHVKNGITRQNA